MEVFGSVAQLVELCGKLNMGVAETVGFMKVIHNKHVALWLGLGNLVVTRDIPHREIASRIGPIYAS